jgi:hypothetical protein
VLQIIGCVLGDKALYPWFQQFRNASLEIQSNPHL